MKVLTVDGLRTRLASAHMLSLAFVLLNYEEDMPAPVTEVEEFHISPEMKEDLNLPEDFPPTVVLLRVDPFVRTSRGDTIPLDKSSTPPRVHSTDTLVDQLFGYSPERYIFAAEVGEEERIYAVMEDSSLKDFPEFAWNPFIFFLACEQPGYAFRGEDDEDDKEWEVL